MKRAPEPLTVQSAGWRGITLLGVVVVAACGSAGITSPSQTLSSGAAGTGSQAVGSSSGAKFTFEDSGTIYSYETDMIVGQGTSLTVKTMLSTTWRDMT